ncbi:MAG: OmpP1/FadL family transporter [Myxococcota bacterium]
MRPLRPVAPALVAPALVVWTLSWLLLAGHPAAAQLRPAHTGGAATADSAATVYSNPAGMARLERPDLVMQMVLAYSESQFEVSEGTTTDGGDSDTNENVIVVPSIYFASPALHERLRLGLSLNVPSGIGSDYGDEWAGRYITTESSLVFVALNAAASIRLFDFLSIGGSVEFLYTESKTRSKVNNRGEDLPDGRVELETDGVGVGGSVSALFELGDRHRLGVVYRPKTETDVDGVPEFDGLGPALTAALAAGGLFNQRVEIGMNSPQRVQVGLYSEPIDRLSLTLDSMWIDMKDFGNVDVSVGNSSTSVDGEYQDMWTIGASAGWRFTDDLEALVGFHYISPAISDSNRTLSLPFDRIYVVGAGLRYAWTKWMEISTSVNYYDTGDSRVDTEPNARAGRVVGEFDPSYAVAIDLGVQFRF